MCYSYDNTISEGYFLTFVQLAQRKQQSQLPFIKLLNLCLFKVCILLPVSNMSVVILLIFFVLPAW